MKSHTDLKQSKKLAEILSIESSDGYWFKGFPPQPYMVYTKGTYNPGEHIPCWSLAALLDVLPNFIGDYGKCLYYDVGGYYCGYMVDGDFMLTIEETNADNQIDACFEMIIKLYEQNLL